jgi:hypothetical protein
MCTNHQKPHAFRLQRREEFAKVVTHERRLQLSEGDDPHR